MAYFTGIVLACCLTCRAFRYNWNQSIHGNCGDQKSLDLFIRVFNLLMDTATVASTVASLMGTLDGHREEGFHKCTAVYGNCVRTTIRPYFFSARRATGQSIYGHLLQYMHQSA